MKYSRSSWALALALPVLGFLGSVAFAESRLHGAPEVELAISGFDPRDLVRGHYLQYRVDFQAHESLTQDEKPTWDGDLYRASGACLTSTTVGKSSILAYEGATPPHACQKGFPIEHLRAPHRIYVEQTRASELERAVLAGRASVRVALLSESHVLTRELLIDGQPWAHVKSFD